jgi:DNA modification methylase
MIIKQEEITTVGQVKPNSLIQGDCLEVMKFLADKSIDMVLCDLPYG